MNQVKVLHRPRLLSDNGPSYLSSELGQWLEDNGIRHIRGRPYHPMTQGKIERYHRSMKNRILLDNYYLPGQLEQSIEEFVRYYNTRLRGDARGRHGGVRQELAAGVVLRSGGPLSGANHKTFARSEL